MVVLSRRLEPIFYYVLYYCINGGGWGVEGSITGCEGQFFGWCLCCVFFFFNLLKFVAAFHISDGVRLERLLVIYSLLFFFTN